MDALLGIISFVFIFGLVVFVHEFGHYIFARLRGVGVEAFAIGMGPKITSWTKNGTEYSLRWLPVGGYVRLHEMIAEEAEEEDPEDAQAAAGEQAEADSSEDGEKTPPDPMGEAVNMAALYKQGVFTKLLVFSGGVFFNYLTAIAATVLLFSIGFERQAPPPAWIGALEDDSPFAQAGLEEGDYIIEVDGEPVETITDYYTQVAELLETEAAADGLAVKVRRGGDPGRGVDLTFPGLTEKSLEDVYSLGPMFEYAPAIGEVMMFSPADEAGLQSGDMIIEINDKKITKWSELLAAVRPSADIPMSVRVYRAKEDREILFGMIPREDALNEGVGQLGVALGSSKQIWVRLSVGEAILHAPGEVTWQVTNLASQIYAIFHSSISNRRLDTLRKSFGGPVAIAQMTTKAAKKGFRELLRFFIHINLMLAIINLLPIPVFDGGFIVLSVIEGVVRRPVPARILNPIYAFFAIGIIGLFIVLTYQDVLRWLL